MHSYYLLSKVRTSPPTRSSLSSEVRKSYYYQSDTNTTLSVDGNSPFRDILWQYFMYTHTWVNLTSHHQKSQSRAAISWIWWVCTIYSTSFWPFDWRKVAARDPTPPPSAGSLVEFKSSPRLAKHLQVTQGDLGKTARDPSAAKKRNGQPERLLEKERSERNTVVTQLCVELGQVRKAKEAEHQLVSESEIWVRFLTTKEWQLEEIVPIVLST